MSKITQTKLARAKWRDGVSKDYKRTAKRITGYAPAQAREWLKCQGCDRKKLLSVGQIWKCNHKD